MNAAVIRVSNALLSMERSLLFSTNNLLICLNIERGKSTRQGTE